MKRRNEREMEEYSSVLDQKINRLVELNNLITTHSRVRQVIFIGL